MSLVSSQARHCSAVRHLPLTTRPVRLLDTYRPTRHLLHASCRERRNRVRGPPPVAVLAAEARPSVAADPVGDIEKYLLQIGWKRGWVDIVAERLSKKDFSTTVARTEAVVRFLERLGIPIQSTCNMCALAPRIIGRDPDTELAPVVDYIKARGVTGAKLVELLEANPKLLLFDPAADGTSLVRGKARASVDVIEGWIGASFWREGAAFQTAPVAPYPPVLKQ